MRKEDCIFCKIANGEIPSKSLYEDEKFRVILDLGPAAKGIPSFCPKIMLQIYMNFPKSCGGCDDPCKEDGESFD